MIGGIREEYMGILTYFWVIEHVHMCNTENTCSVFERNERSFAEGLLRVAAEDLHRPP